MSEIKTGGLDQYGAGPFEQQQCGTADVEGVKVQRLIRNNKFENVIRNPFAPLNNWPLTLDPDNSEQNEHLPLVEVS